MSSNDYEKRQDASDIRQDHAEQKAAADKFVTEQQAIALVSHVDELTVEVKDLRTTLTKRNRLLIGIGGFILATGLVFVLLLSLALDNQAVMKRQGRIIEAVTGCTIHDTQSRCQDKQAERSLTEGLKRLEGVKCIVRSVHEGEPDPVTDQRCLPKEAK